MTIEIIISIVSSILLALSEILPLIKNVKYNGIIDFFVKIIEKKKMGDEEEGLLNNNEHDSQLNDRVDELKSNIITLSTNYNSLHGSFIKIYENIVEYRMLQTFDKYELDYIKNFIRINYPEKQLELRFLAEINKTTLKNLGYIIDYDSTNQMYCIKW